MPGQYPGFPWSAWLCHCLKQGNSQNGTGQKFLGVTNESINHVPVHVCIINHGHFLLLIITVACQPSLFDLDNGAITCL